MISPNNIYDYHIFNAKLELSLKVINTPTSNFWLFKKLVVLILIRLLGYKNGKFLFLTEYKYN
jgi:hypothetical protein